MQDRARAAGAYDRQRHQLAHGLRRACDRVRQRPGQLTDGGQYTLNVTATDSTGQSVYGYTTVTGKVTSIDNSTGTPMLKIGSTSVSTSNVIGVTA